MSRIILIIALFLLWVPVFPQPGTGQQHQLTIYVIPSSYKYDWTSPHTLHISTIKNYIKSMFSTKSYLLGHAFLELRTPLLDEPLLTGMRAVSRDEQKQYVFKDDYGLAILGTHLNGRLDHTADLENSLEKYSKKGRIAFIRFDISEAAVNRLLEYYQEFQMRLDSIGMPGPCYGGVFWPRYYGEGSGCSAFVVSFMDVAGLMQDEFDEWDIDINIPMDLIGGPFNDNREVTMKDIKKCREWSDGEGSAGKDYEPFHIYDPTIMYEWVQQHYDQPEIIGDMLMSPMKMNKSKGIEIDAKDMPVPQDAFFYHREEPSIFINYFTSSLLTNH
jgi:hypothetical protein